MAKSARLQKALIDRIGDLRAQKSEVETILATLQEQAIRELGEGHHEGDKFVLNISLVTKTVTKWKDIAMKLGATTRMIKANSTNSEYTRVTCNAHKR